MCCNERDRVMYVWDIEGVLHREATLAEIRALRAAPIPFVVFACTCGFGWWQADRDALGPLGFYNGRSPLINCTGRTCTCPVIELVCVVPIEYQS